MKTTLREWLSSNQSTDRLRQLNYNMSNVMKDIHNRKVYIRTFNLGQISLDDENLYPIQFESIDKSDDIERDKKNNIYNLSFMFIGLHTGMLNDLNPQFLKDNFDQFAVFLPKEDVEYYSGIVTKGYRNYYSDYIDELRRTAVEHNVGASNSASTNSNAKSNEMVKSKQFAKSTAVGRAYKELYENKAAFVNYLIIPIIFIVIALVVVLILLFIS